jgi:hypothetical protein
MRIQHGNAESAVGPIVHVARGLKQVRVSFKTSSIVVPTTLRQAWLFLTIGRSIRS